MSPLWFTLLKCAQSLTVNHKRSFICTQLRPSHFHFTPETVLFPHVWLWTDFLRRSTEECFRAPWSRHHRIDPPVLFLHGFVSVCFIKGSWFALNNEIFGMDSDFCTRGLRSTPAETQQITQPRTLIDVSVLKYEPQHSSGATTF